MGTYVELEVDLVQTVCRKHQWRSQNCQIKAGGRKQKCLACFKFDISNPRTLINKSLRCLSEHNPLLPVGQSSPTPKPSATYQGDPEFPFRCHRKGGVRPEGGPPLQGPLGNTSFRSDPSLLTHQCYKNPGLFSSGNGQVCGFRKEFPPRFVCGCAMIPS
uniref:Retinoic acid receptor responder protein 2 n=1 Tax=Pseudonaja textilis TaxID=8673 RepID=A0A670ZQ69_PSETE